MASRIKDLAGSILGKKAKGIGSTMYHAADGVTDGGILNAKRQHIMKMALHRQRMRPSGMTDQFFGAKEVGGTQQNPHEAKV